MLDVNPMLNAIFSYTRMQTVPRTCHGPSSQCQRYRREEIWATLVSHREHWNGSQETAILVPALPPTYLTKDFPTQVAGLG